MAVELADIPYVLVALLISFAFHEFGHAITAYKLGDSTPKAQGRLNLWPHNHLDPIGFIAFFIVGFGWAKAVEINPMNLKHPRRDDILISLAGPAGNMIVVLLTFLIWYPAIALGISDYVSAGTFDILYKFFDTIVFTNIALFIFNLLPIPPLDGFHIFKNIVFHGESLDKVEAAEKVMSIAAIAIIATGMGDFILNPFYDNLMPWIFNLFDSPLAKLLGLS